MHNFNFVAFVKYMQAVLTFRHDASIHFNRYPAQGIALVFKQIRKAYSRLQVECLTIQEYLHSAILARCDKIGAASYFCHVDVA